MIAPLQTKRARALDHQVRAFDSLKYNESGVDGHMAEERVRTIWFYRDYRGLTGGELKHSHYFDHVLRAPGFTPKITFGGELLNESHARERRRLWPAGGDGAAARWEPGRRDVLFLAGVDWRYLAENGLESLPNPRINLIQHVRHAHEGTELYRYLAERAIRICVSREVADAISATGRTRGPVLTIPNGIDLAPADPAGGSFAAALRARSRPITIVGYKRPDLALALSRRLDEERIAHPPATEFIERRRFLDLLAESRVAVCLPHAEEGFYLPALEAMAAGCLVVTLDCIGNRGFCRHGGSCLIAEPGLDSLWSAVESALDMPAQECERMLREARDTVAGHSLEAERKRFQAILADVDRLWRMDGQEVGGGAAAPAGSSRCGPATPDTRGPRLDFMIVGAQKCGTTALSHFLSRHPGIGMADPKEPHLFDAPDYSGDWSPEEIDERYRPSFEHCPGAAVRGEATPTYMFLPEVARELERYNPELKLIVLLRDPVERAISQYCMERDRGDEHLPLWLALSSEPFRLRRCRDARQPDSAMRRHSYRRRGLYSLQLRNLYRFFRKDRVLVIRTRDLLQHHDAVLRQVFAFLGVSGDVRIAPGMIYPPVPRKDGGAGVHRTVSWLLRLSYLAESVRLRALLRHARIVEPSRQPGRGVEGEGAIHAARVDRDIEQ